MSVIYYLLCLTKSVFLSVGPMNISNWIILCCGVVLLCLPCRCWASSLDFTHQMSVDQTPPHVSCDNQKCLRHGQMYPDGGGQNYHQLRTTGLNCKEASYENDSNSLASATTFFPGNQRLMEEDFSSYPWVPVSFSFLNRSQTLERAQIPATEDCVG